MNSGPGDRIHIRDLTVPAVIGVYPEERNIRQELVLNVEIVTNLKEAGLTDNFELTVDYDTLTEKYRNWWRTRHSNSSNQWQNLLPTIFWA
jgi:FolB domain-containing protein